jgi:mannose-6-phosphate isomerase-like protein (cupin superfamily)
MALAEGTSRASLDRGSTERFVGLRKELGVSTFGINQMNLQPGQQGRIHRHERQEEVYVVLDGELTVTVEGTDVVLGPDEILRVAPALRRRLSNRSQAPVTLIALGGSGEHQGRDGEAFTDWDQQEGAPPQEVPLPEDLPLS